VRTLALETAIGQQEAEAAAEAEAAKMDLEQRNRLDVARIRAGGEGGEGGTEKSRAEYLYNSTFSTAFEEAIKPDPMTGKEPLPYGEAVEAARQAALSIAPNAPSAQAYIIEQGRQIIVSERAKGRSDDEIRKDLEELGFDPAMFGL
jgi:hypothetical protein